jgi:hypothetical protein
VLFNIELLCRHPFILPKVTSAFAVALKATGQANLPGTINKYSVIVE